MNRYDISWQYVTAVVLVIYLFWLRLHHRSWLIAPILGALAFLPGIIACYVSRR